MTFATSPDSNALSQTMLHVAPQQSLHGVEPVLVLLAGAEGIVLNVSLWKNAFPRLINILIVRGGEKCGISQRGSWSHELSACAAGPERR